MGEKGPTSATDCETLTLPVGLFLQFGIRAHDLRITNILVGNPIFSESCGYLYT